MLDLHNHTTYSDGTLSPADLVKEATTAGVKALAITDHDTLAGWDEAFSAAGDVLEIVPGVELSTTENGRSLHVLGFYPNRDALDPALQERLEVRRERAAAMVERLAELGLPITLPAMEGNRAPGRPHLAAAMVSAGYATSMDEVFDRWLGDHGPAYVPYAEFSAADGIRLLRDCGAVPVWAHPYLFRGGTVETVLPRLVEAGLMGLEVYHPSHSPSDVRRLEAFCQRYGLVMTGGSDYHGPSPDRQRAKDQSHLNQLQLPLALLEPLQRAKASLQAATHAE
ncbi:PHP domain-containing protein [Phormidium sp. FACHB-1136]|uniref:PHP domain-containing protein n=1 Tax=Phormidium sp. FACHB-1136 TaxID=2692848 RepID=UPI001688C247|nr:PHP domain-containing protein [Phormidium sp. FACHB-1136]MBD2427161.1 PHP domain-containing protein [Phormidium sp. FACHB-1136]